MVEAGKVVATFELVSKNAMKGLEDIKKKINEVKKTTDDYNTTAGKSNKTLTQSQKIVKDLEKSSAIHTKNLKKDLDATKLSNVQKMKLVDTIGRLDKGLKNDEISLSKYNKSMGLLAKQYGLTYKNGKLFDASLAKQNKSVKEASTLMADLFKKTQMTRSNKVFGTSTSDITAFNKGMAQANAELEKGKMSISQYKAYRKELADLNNLTVKNNGLVFDNKYLAEVNGRMQNYIKLHDSMILSKQRGIPISETHNNLLRQNAIGLQELETWKRAGIISQTQYSNILSRTTGQYEKLRVTTSGLNKSYGSLANSTNMISRSQRMQNYAMQVAAMRYNAVGMAVGAFGGMLLGDFAYGFVYAREQSIRLDQQMQQFFSTMKLGKGAFEEFNKALDDYVKTAPKVNKYTIGATIAQVGKLNNLSLKEMKDAIPVIADISNMMQLNGRTSEDTMLAINDAFDNQFKRLQEIGVQGKKQLMDEYGYDGKTAESLIQALNKMDQAKGWSDLSKNITTASDAFQVLGNAIDRIIVPAVNLATPLIVGISVAIADLLSWLNDAPPAVSAVASVIMVLGGSFVFMKAQMLWARTLGTEMMASLTGLDKGMQRVTNTMFSARQVTSMLPKEFDNVANQMARAKFETENVALEWENLTDKTKTNLVQQQKARIAYESLSTTQKQNVQTLMRMKGLELEEAMVATYGRKAVESNTVATAKSNVVKNTSIASSIRQTYANVMNTASTDAETGARSGNTVATSINTMVKSVATKTTELFAKAQLFLASTTGLVTVGLLALVVAIGAVAYAMSSGARKSAETMKEYNDFLENGEDKINALKDASKAYIDEAHDLEATRDRLKAQGENTTQIEKKIADCYSNSAKMAQQAKDAEEALEKGRAQKKLYDAQHLTSQNNYNQQTIDMLKQYGIINQKQYDDKKKYNELVLAGGAQVYTALQRENRIRGIGLDQTKQILDGQHEYSKAFKKDAEEGGKAIEDRAKAYDELANVVYEDQTSGDWMQKLWLWGVEGVLKLKIGWIDTQMQIKNGIIWITDGFNGFCKSVTDTANAITSYLGGAWNNTVAWFTNGFNQIIGFFTGIGSWISDGISSAISGITGFGQQIWTTIFGTGNGDDIVSQFLQWIQGIDWVNMFNEGMSWIATMIAHYNPVTLLVALLFGNDTAYAFQDNIYNFLMGMVTTFENGLNIVWSTVVTLFYTYIVTPIQTIWDIINVNAQNAWAWFSGIVIGAWNAIVGTAQWVWGLVYTYIYSPIARAYNAGVAIFNNLRSFLGGVWNGIVSAVNNAWNTVRNAIINAMNAVWSRINPIISGIRSAFNNMRSALVSGAQAIYNGVWVNFLKPLSDRLHEFWNFITHPFGGGGGSAGSPDLEAGSPNLSRRASAGYVSVSAGKGLSSSPRMQMSSDNNVFAGLGRAIKARVASVVNSTGITADPRFNTGNIDLPAGSPDLSAGKLITDPYECKDPDQCYAGGWDIGSTWIDGIKNLVSNWTMNIMGTATKITDLANGQGNLALFTAIASKLIAGTRYQYYMGDGKSDAQALKDRSFNCFDGAQILIDLAHGMGLSASMGHGFWGKTRHAWAVINGKPFDTTAYQHGYGWTSPAVTGYGSKHPTAPIGTTIEINLEFTGDIHGIEDYERKMNDVAHAVFYKLFGGSNPLVG